MAGSLFHADVFTVNRYIGNDGQAHHEVCGNADVVSWSSWEELKEYGKTIGIPIEAWPEFLDCDSGIDVDLELATRKCVLFNSFCKKLPRDLPYPYWFDKILRYLDRGETVFFC